MTEKEEKKIIKLLEEKNYQEAIKICNDILNTNNEDEIAYFYRGSSKYYLKEYKGAIEDYNKSIELNPNNENSYLQRGDCKKYIKEYKEAIKDYDKVIELNSNNEYAYLQRGYCKNNIEEYKEAIEDFNIAININPYNPDNKAAYNNIGLSRTKLNLYEESIEDYNKAIDLDSEYLIAYYNRGLSKNYFGLYKEAIIDFNKVIKSDKNDAAAYYNRGLSKNYFGLYKEAIIDFSKFIELIKNYSFLKISDIIGTFFYNIKIIDIEYNFIKLIEDDYNDLWKNDPIFKLLDDKINDKDILYYIKNILLYQHLLLKSLSFNINDNIEISHYTSLNTLLLLLNDKKEYKKEKGNKDNKEDEGKIRIVNISNANDPKEGKILESIFNKNGLGIKLKNNENLITLQTSFSRNKDSLTMFRLYGKNENKEATGICLVIDKEYFNDKYFSTPVQESIILRDDKNSNKNEEEQIDSLKINLFWIIYYNEKENKLVFSSEDSKYKNIIIDLKNIKNLKNKDRFKKNKITLKNKKEIIEYIFSNIYYYAKELNKEIKDKNLKNEIFSNLFENIKYLIKDEAFFEEQELRMLITTNYEDKLIEMDNDNKRLYINYIKLFDKNNNYINEIILGPKIENSESMVEYIKKVLSNKYSKEGIKKKDIKVSISKAPLR